MTLLVPPSRFTSRVGGGSAFYVRPKLHAIDGVECLTMKKQISGFILGALFGGVVIFTIAADSSHPTVWEYKAVNEKVPSYLYTKTLNDATTNGWELVSSQIILKEPETPSLSDSVVFMVLKHPKQ